MFALALAFASCQSDDTDFSDIIGATDNSGASSSDTTSTTTEAKSIAIDSTDCSETETIPTSASSSTYNDYVENSEFNYTVTITYSGTSATISGDTSKVTVNKSGAHVVIKSAAKNVAYVLTGSSTDGSFKIYNDSKFLLTLSGVTLTNPTGAVINNQSGKSMYVVLTSGSVNTLTDGTTYTSTSSSEDMKGTIFSEGQVIFSGGGKLNVYAHCKNGIASDDYIRFRPGNKIYVKNTASNGVKAKDGIFINGGVLNVEVSANAAKGLNSESDIDVQGGRTTIITSGGSTIEGNDTSSCAAVKCDSVFTMKSGIMNLKSTGEGGKGINAAMNVNLNGGTLNVVTLGTKIYSSPKGIKSDKNIYITAGSIYSYSAYSDPIDAGGTLSVASGYATYTDKDKYVIISY